MCVCVLGGWGYVQFFTVLKSRELTHKFLTLRSIKLKLHYQAHSPLLDHIVNQASTVTTSYTISLVLPTVTYFSRRKNILQVL